PGVPSVSTFCLPSCVNSCSTCAKSSITQTCFSASYGLMVMKCGFLIRLSHCVQASSWLPFASAMVSRCSQRASTPTLPFHIFTEHRIRREHRTQPSAEIHESEQQTRDEPKN